ncbi:MAG: TetR-like C-terminal domain-containing protein [Hydrogeniiclostridium sp.]
MELLCSYFYENRNFYRRALRVKGQNSFSEHFREFPCSVCGSRRSSDVKPFRASAWTFSPTASSAR